MASKSKTKTPAPQVVKQNGASKFTPQPGQIVVMSETDILIAAPWLNDGYMKNRAYGLRAGVPTVIPARVLEPRSDGWRMHSAGMFVVTEGIEGVMPEVVDAADSCERTIWSTGAPPPINHEQLIDHWTGVVVARSLAAAIVECIEAGIDPQVAATTLAQVYDDSFITRPPTASQEPWRSRAAEMVLAERARRVGL